MTIDELSDEEQQELAKMYRGIGSADMTALAITAKWGPREIDEMIFNLKQVRDFFEDIEHLQEECNSPTDPMQRRIEMINGMLKLLRKQRNHIEDTAFY